VGHPDAEETEARGIAFDGSEFVISSSRWAHILDRHPDLTGTIEAVKDAAARPDEVYEDERGTLHLLKRQRMAISEFLVLIVRRQGAKTYLVTAYFMSSKRKTRGYRRFKKQRLFST
jgi:hypothetical protein